LLSSSILGVLAQRLVRQLCDECKTPKVVTDSDRETLGLSPDTDATIYQAVGCEACNRQGYRGRTGIYELVVVTDEIREAIHEGASEAQIEQLARANSQSIRADGRAKVLAGLTTVEEVLRVTRED
jgi:general secretion pathway protein E